MNRIKVLHVITKLELGGAQRFTLYTIDSLNRELFEPFLLSGKGGILDEKVLGRSHTYLIEKLVREISPLKDIKALKEIRDVIRKIKPHIIHTHSSKAGILGRWAGYLEKVPVIIHTVHGFGFSPFHPFLKRSAFCSAEKVTARITDKIFFVSKEDMKYAILNKITTPEKSSIVRSIVPFENFIRNSRMKEKLRKKFSLPSDAIIIGGVFPFKPQKDPLGFIEIARLSLKKEKNLFFAIAGDGELKEKIVRKIKKYKIESKVRLYGWVENIDEFIPALDYMLFSSLWEGLPQSAIQALAGKVQIISTNVNGLKEVVFDGETGYKFSPQDYKMGAEKLLFIMKNPIKQEIFEKRRKQVLEEFSPEKQIKLHEKIYIELLKKKGLNFSLPDYYKLL